jgi:hypothetical protein
LDKRIVEKNLKTKGNKKKSANEELQLKIKMERGQIRKFPYCYSI